LALSCEDWENAALRAAQLSSTQLRLGKLQDALESANRDLQYAKKTAGTINLNHAEAAVAVVLHQNGDIDAALNHYRSGVLTKDGGRALIKYEYCDLLLDRGEDPRSIRSQLEPWNTANEDFLTDGVNHLILARIELAARRGAVLDTLLDEPFSKAVDLLRKSGRIQDLPLGLLARAAYFRIAEKYGRAQRDLAEAMRIATRPGSGMQLFECDAHLEFARLELAQGNRKAARPHLTRAEELVAATGYHRRDKDLAELKAAFGR